MAAYRHGIKTVIIPEENIKDLEDIDRTVREALSFCPVSHADEVIKCALDFSKAPAREEEKKNVTYSPEIEGVCGDNKLRGICQ